MINGKRIGMSIHKAVAMTFLYEDYKDGLVINHKDGNKQNNHVSNLEWVTSKENAIHSVNVLGNNLSVRNGMAVSIVAINIETGNQFKFDCIADCARAIKEKLNLYTNERYIQSSINRVLIGERKSYHKYIFKYI